MSLQDRIARFLEAAPGQDRQHNRRDEPRQDRNERVQRRCEDCGGDFSVTRRTVRRRGGGRWCRDCISARAGRAAKPIDALVGIPLYHLQEAPCVVASHPAWVLPGGALLSLHSFIPPGIDSSTP